MEARPAGLETLFDQLYLQLKTTQPADMLAVVKTALEARDAASKSAETAAAAPKPKKPAAKKK